MIYIETFRVIFYNKEEEYHRENGPAVIYGDDYQEWCKNGDLHRIGGPAVIGGNIIQWYIEGNYYKECNYYEKLKEMGLR